MNEIEERVYTLTDSANSLAAELYDALEMIRYDPVGATSDDMEFIQVRNRCMVDRSDLVVCYVERKTGGAFQTKAYAEKTDKLVLNIALNSKNEDILETF